MEFTLFCLLIHTGRSSYINIVTQEQIEQKDRDNLNTRLQLILFVTGKIIIEQLNLRVLYLLFFMYQRLVK